MIVSNTEKRHFLCSDDDELSRGPRESQGQFKNYIKMKKKGKVVTIEIMMITLLACNVKTTEKRKVPKFKMVDK